MTIILFLIDTSGSMNQRVHYGARPTLLDVTKETVEKFIKVCLILMILAFISLLYFLILQVYKKYTRCRFYDNKKNLNFLSFFNSC